MTDQLQTFPSNTAPLSDTETGVIQQVWLYLLQTLYRRTGGSGAVLEPEEITVTDSPFNYQAELRGAVIVSGGTITEIDFTRAGLPSIDVGIKAGMFPVMPGDVITVIYSVLPEVYFMPSESVD